MRSTTPAWDTTWVTGTRVGHGSNRPRAAAQVARWPPGGVAQRDEGRGVDVRAGERLDGGVHVVEGLREAAPVADAAVLHVERGPAPPREVGGEGLAQRRVVLGLPEASVEDHHDPPAGALGAAQVRPLGGVVAVGEALGHRLLLGGRCRVRPRASVARTGAGGQRSGARRHEQRAPAQARDVAHGPGPYPPLPGARCGDRSPPARAPRAARVRPARPAGSRSRRRAAPRPAPRTAPRPRPCRHRSARGA